MERDRIGVSDLFAIPNLLLHYLTRIALVRSEHRREGVPRPSEEGPLLKRNPEVEVLQSSRLRFFIQFSISGCGFHLRYIFEDYMYVTVEALRFWLWVFRFSQFRAVSVMDFSILCNFEVSIQFHVSVSVQLSFR